MFKSSVFCAIRMHLRIFSAICLDSPFDLFNLPLPIKNNAITCRLEHLQRRPNSAQRAAVDCHASPQALWARKHCTTFLCGSIPRRRIFTHTGYLLKNKFLYGIFDAESVHCCLKFKQFFVKAFDRNNKLFSFRLAVSA